MKGVYIVEKIVQEEFDKNGNKIPWEKSSCAAILWPDGEVGKKGKLRLIFFQRSDMIEDFSVISLAEKGDKIKLHLGRVCLLDNK